MENTISEKKIVLKNNLSELAVLSDSVEELGNIWNISNEDIFKFNLVLEEIVTNIVNYGYDDKNEHEIEILFKKYPDSLCITIKDDAKAFNPLTKEDPDINIPLEERKIGGLGIFLTKKMMDKVEYFREQNFNILIISKKVN